MSFIKPDFLGSKVHFSNQYITVKTNSVILKKNNNGIIEEYSKDYYLATSKDFVSGIVIKEDKLLLVKQYRIAIKDFALEFVAGAVEDDETPEIAIHKELIEEAGIKSNNIKFLGNYHPLIGCNENMAHIFLIDDFVEVDRKLELYEQFTNLTIEWIPILEFRHLIHDRKIIDGTTLAAWTMFKESIYG